MFEVMQWLASVLSEADVLSWTHHVILSQVNQATEEKNSSSLLILEMAKPNALPLGNQE